MLMMVDREVHFHVLPRYADQRIFGHNKFIDPGWPGPPDLSQNAEVSDTVKQRIQQALQKLFRDEC